MGLTNNERYVECRKHAVATDSLDSFRTCVERVLTFHENGGGSIETLQFYTPMCSHDLNEMQFSTSTLHGAVCFYNDRWSVHT